MCRPAPPYVIGNTGVVLSSGLQVFDIDATPPSTLQGIHTATVSISSGFFAGDQLFVDLPTSGGFFIVDEGSGPVVTNISVTSNAAGTMVLGGTDTTLRYQLVLDAVNYRSTAADPTNGGHRPESNHHLAGERRRAEQPDAESGPEQSRQRDDTALRCAARGRSRCVRTRHWLHNQLHREWLSRRDRRHRRVRHRSRQRGTWTRRRSF
jgi:hypothetical protein